MPDPALAGAQGHVFSNRLGLRFHVRLKRDGGASVRDRASLDAGHDRTTGGAGARFGTIFGR